MEDNKTPNVGTVIRANRIKKNITLKELSKLCSLSVNALSKIERGENSPTVASLHKISSALNVHISNFFVREINQTIIITRNSKSNKLDLDGLIFEGLGSGLINQKLEPFIISIPPGSDNSTDPSSHTGDEFLYCLDGKIEYTIAETTYSLSTGDSILFKASQPHNWNNISDSIVKVLMIFETNPNNKRPH